jgi:putative flippase GtrA
MPNNMPSVELRKLKPSRALFRALFLEPANHGMVQFVRYGFVAVVAFAFDFGLLFVFTEYLHMFYVLSATLSFAISVVVNYFLSVSWAFGVRVERQRTVEIGLFIAICVVALSLNDVFIWLFTSAFGLYYLFSKLLTVAIVFFWSFGARRLVFHSAFFKNLLNL